jgi:glycosyltransferase involved in cell wall biosynthesis
MRSAARICILSISAIADDPRVRRQGDAFKRAGWGVVGVGLSGAQSTPPEWLMREPNRDPPQALGPQPPPRRGFARRLREAGRGGGFAYWSLRWLFRLLFQLHPNSGFGQAFRLFLIRFRAARAERFYWTVTPLRPLSVNVNWVYTRASAVEADVWLANDWTALPLAARLAREKGGRYCYDTHEFAAEEYAERWKWRLLHKPMVRALEQRFIHGAAVASAVSAGIAERLDAMYQLAHPTLTIRNTPRYEKTEFRPTGEGIRVLYHGIVTVGRGLEAAIDSVVSWRPEFDLTIRGPGLSDYADALRRRIRDLRLESRVSLVPPVPMTELVREASAFDIGFFALPAHSRHNKFALPNKFFEYVMAGLALCVSDLPEMARLVREYRLGVLMPEVAPMAIARTVNALDRDQINESKRYALAAARELCWERESERLIAAYRGLGPRASAVAAS